MTLVIFDYSGTLSLSTIEFGKPDNLERHLEESGLASIGIDTAGRYWREVVNPSWAEASTSNAGFRSVAAGCIGALELPGAAPRTIKTAVTKFMDAYMRHSHIAEKWRPLLAEIQARPETVGLIATDHYAEATPAIRSHLSTLGIASIPAIGKKIPADKSAFIVANSADIGCLKADSQFWLHLKKTCLPTPINKVALVDDFGSNEQDQNGYAKNHSIANRITATRQALGKVFSLKPQVVHFQIGQDTDRTISTTIKTIREILQS